MKLTIHTDGGARGNPGPAAIGVSVVHNGKTIGEVSKAIGEATNNVAEYQAVVEALLWIQNSNMRPREIAFFLDSTLVVNQLNGIFKIKEPHLRELLLRIKQLEQGIDATISYTAVRREFNKRADFLVNQALDA